MGLVVLIGAQAVGKMTVGKELEKQINGKLLYNHQTIDLFANFLDYGSETFRLSDLVRKELFQAFVRNKAENTTDTIIFTVLIDFDSPADQQFLQDISAIFLEAGEEVFLAELVTDLQTRMSRNICESRLAAKPSKRNIEHSQQELLLTAAESRLMSKPGELEKLVPNATVMVIDNTNLSPVETAEQIKQMFQ
ncbi:hypothetical protein [Candidatus Enterococcus willemsii]|uniref:Shikimate kinase n=1 Tax=Candidatus Enterococcus willemsii TaxID=1857215 RepID=A0ABQ6YY81_9ENTE|nr:hypothetical protein [Enterococcus sp. CU12B]KAF1303039.1 hypothetical protein BAU17_07875 [Enterococcus sp. CU12B]